MATSVVIVTFPLNILVLLLLPLLIPPHLDGTGAALEVSPVSKHRVSVSGVEFCSRCWQHVKLLRRFALLPLLYGRCCPCCCCCCGSCSERAAAQLQGTRFDADCAFASSRSQGAVSEQRSSPLGPARPFFFPGAAAAGRRPSIAARRP